MNPTVFDIDVFRWGYKSQSEERFTGTVKELKQTMGIRHAIGNHNPRTEQGLQKVLDKYAKTKCTTYTGIEYHVTTNYGKR